MAKYGHFEENRDRMHRGTTGRFGLRPTNPVRVKQTEFGIKPLLTPPLPAETFALPGSHQVPPNLLFYPVFNKREAPARMPHRKVVHPSPENRVDQFDHPSNRLAGEPSEHIPELPQQRRSLL